MGSTVALGLAEGRSFPLVSNQDLGVLSMAKARERQLGAARAAFRLRSSQGLDKFKRFGN